MKFLKDVSTHWSQIERLKEAGELRELTDYLAARYFNILVAAFKQNCSKLDDFSAYELTSDVFFDFMKNDYHTLKKINRNKGKLRGLFYTIVRRKLHKLPQAKESLEQIEREVPCLESYVDVLLDLEKALDSLEQKKAILYESFYLYTFHGKSISEISQQLEISNNSVKKRIYRARTIINESMIDY